MGAPDTLTALAMLADWQAAGRPQPIEVEPGTVAMTRPAYLVAQYREATSVEMRCLAIKGEWTDAEDAAYDAARATVNDVREALRTMLASWGVNPDHFAEALA